MKTTKTISGYLCWVVWTLARAFAIGLAVGLLAAFSGLDHGTCSVVAECCQMIAGIYLFVTAS